jgi:glycosyltransferase involved in cell wall biosynthesis
MNEPFFSVIIPTYNRCAQLRECLLALARQACSPDGFEVIVVVDGSTDGTATMLREMALPYSLDVALGPNGGAGHARNVGSTRARGRYLAFTEDDVIPDTHWLQSARSILEPDQWDVLEGRTVYRGTDSEVRKFERERRLSFIPCNLFVRRTVFEAVGGYSPEFHDSITGLYFREDSDFGFRLMDARARIRIAEDVYVSHPLQFLTLAGCFRHARRYVFDPLLYKRHPRHFREQIEVKQLFGFTVHRAQHYVALADAFAFVLGAAGLLFGSMAAVVGGVGGILLCGALFRFKYQGSGFLKVHRLHETVGFLGLPFVYLWALLRGCVRYRVIGVLW